MNQGKILGTDPHMAESLARAAVRKGATLRQGLVFITFARTLAEMPELLQSNAGFDQAVEWICARTGLADIDVLQALLDLRRLGLIEMVSVEPVAFFLNPATAGDA
jgi:chaperonin GroEL (HSP60 family)